MATPGKLRDVVADALGLSAQIQMVDVHLRNLREAGLISKAKRGRGAAEVGPTDAANMLIAVAGSAYVKESVGTVEKYGSLEVDPSALAFHGWKNLQAHFYGHQGWVFAEHTKFSQALSRILVLISEGRFFSETSDRLADRQRREYISVRLYWPFAAASIHYGFDRQYEVHQLFGALPLRDGRTAWNVSTLRAGVLCTLRVIDHISLRKVAMIFPPDGLSLEDNSRRRS
jgi:hypothetical protein